MNSLPEKEQEFAVDKKEVASAESKLAAVNYEKVEEGLAAENRTAEEEAADDQKAED